MLRNLFRVFSSQNNLKATPASYAPKCIEAAQLKLVAGGAPKGGWMDPALQVASSAPKGGWV